MYSEVLVFHIREVRPEADVILASLQTLQREAEQASPHLVIATEVPLELKEMEALFWVELSTDNSLVAEIGDGYSETIHDVSLEDLVAVLDKAEEELAHDGA